MPNPPSPLHPPKRPDPALLSTSSPLLVTTSRRRPQPPTPLEVDEESAHEEDFAGDLPLSPAAVASWPPLAARDPRPAGRVPQISRFRSRLTLPPHPPPLYLTTPPRPQSPEAEAAASPPPRPPLQSPRALKPPP